MKLWSIDVWMTWKMGAIPAARLYHTKYRELPPPPGGTMWLIGHSFWIFTRIYLGLKQLGCEWSYSFSLSVIVLINSRMFVYFYVFNSKTLLRLQRYSPGLQCSTPRLLTTFYTMLYTMPSSLILIFLLTTRRKVRLLNLHGSVCIFAIFAFNLTVQFRS